MAALRGPRHAAFAVIAGTAVGAATTVGAPWLALRDSLLVTACAVAADGSTSLKPLCDARARFSCKRKNAREFCDNHFYSFL